MHSTLKFIMVLVLVVTVAGCGNDDVLPKPAAQLALRYKQAAYKKVQHNSCAYSFSINAATQAIAGSDCSMKIEYPEMDATIFVSYRPVEDNLRQLLIDGQKLSYGHNRMADVISDYPFSNEENRAFGMMYEIEGNAASNAQFYATDSTRHFLTAALYFDTEPNYDSIYPAVRYVQQDMVKMLESLKWED